MLPPPPELGPLGRAAMGALSRSPATCVGDWASLTYGAQTGQNFQANRGLEFTWATFGGWGRIRTGVNGVAVRCMTTLLPSLERRIVPKLADRPIRPAICGSRSAEYAPS